MSAVWLPISADRGRAVVHELLTNPKYAGVNVYNRRSFKLKRKRINNPAEIWIRRENAFSPIISAEQFKEALTIVEGRHRHFTDDQLLECLKSLLSRFGTLSGILIDEAENMPSTTAYRHRFGSLIRAYSMIGYTPFRDYSYIEANRVVREYHHRHWSFIVGQLQELGATVQHDTASGLLTINQEFTASLILARCHETPTGGYRWLLRLENSLNPDVTIAARLQPGDREIMDYYLFPSMAELASKLRLSSDNGIVLDVHRFENLSFFFSMARRVSVEEVA